MVVLNAFDWQRMRNRFSNVSPNSAIIVMYLLAAFRCNLERHPKLVRNDAVSGTPKRFLQGHADLSSILQRLEDLFRRLGIVCCNADGNVVSFLHR